MLYPSKIETLWKRMLYSSKIETTVTLLFLDALLLLR
jgi:hypothetical protein